jgi:hypothetical protein
VQTADAAGCRIAYDDLGTGEPALLFLTGWCSSRERWAEVARRCAAHRRVLNSEWRGHGDSGPAAADFGTAELVEDALAVVEASGAESVVPCAASHAGWVAIELRRRLGPRVPKLVHADWMLVEPSDRYLAVIEQLNSPEWPEARQTLFTIWAAGVETPPIERALAVMEEHEGEMWMRSGREIGAAYARDGSPLRAFARLDPPPEVLHLYGQPHDPAYLEAQQEFARAHPWFRVRHLDARTHFSMIESAADVADAIEAFVAS